MATRAAAPHPLSNEQLVALLRNMLTQRAIDTRGFQLNRQGKAAIAMGSEGHEAVQAGAGLAFVRGKDVLYPYYRNTGISLACGLPIEALFRSQFARATDTSGGRSIINHCTDRERGIASISSIIAAQCAHAAGAAYAFRFRGEHDRAVLCTFGEGATSEGEWHEAMNFSAIHAVPVIWLCENNQWAISTPITKQMRNTTVADRAIAYGMEGISVDGFDPIAVYTAVRAAREKAVAGDGPTLIEAKCYRFLSHTTDDDDRTYRTRDEVEKQRSHDPVPRFEQHLIDHGVLARDALEKLRAEIAQHVNDMTDRIEAEPLPNPSTLYTQVYAGATEPWL